MVFIRVDLGLLIIIPAALIVHLCQNNTLLALLKVYLRGQSVGLTFQNDENVVERDTIESDEL